jgi:hypothetical protein
LKDGSIDFFRTDGTELEDDKTLQDYKIKNLENIQAFHKEITAKDLYESGSSFVLRFKIQTSDRRGRDTVFLFMKKSDKMRDLRDQYAKTVNVNPEKVRLRFDGEPLPLESTPDECELEGDECLDVVVLS